MEALSLLMSKEEEAFAPYLPGCLGEVWSVLMAAGLHPHQVPYPYPYPYP